ncbi:MAG: hypothetical protein EBU90_30775, partial [Proteobacteria bacterium]|nr:hypothetical protein [Pseudomonadota bacterium]
LKQRKGKFVNDIVLKSSFTTQSVVSDLSDASKAMMEMVKDKDFDVSKMQAIMDMQISMIDRQAKMEFNQDFFALKNEMPVILKKGKISDSMSYVKYEDIHDAINPLLRKYNFCITHTSTYKDNKFLITTTLKHISGHEQSVEFLTASDKVNGLKTEMLAAKSTVSFGKRVNLINMFDLTEVTENSEVYQNQKVTVEQAQIIEDLIIASGAERDKVLKYCGAENIFIKQKSCFKIKLGADYDFSRHSPKFP